MAGNLTAIYELIYQEREISKQNIAVKTGLSLPTVSKNLQALLKEKLIVKGGTFSSTGGRPAEIYQCNENAGIAIGAEMTADQLRIAAVNLYGNILLHKEYSIDYASEESYYRLVCTRINSFIAELNVSEDKLLGLTIAVQGIVSPNRQQVLFSGLLGNAVITRADFEAYLEVPFELVHDAEAAGYAELWQYSDLNNAVYLSLNRYMGSAMILNGRLISGRYLGAGTVEHMQMVPGGRKCYCGSRGCADTLLGIAYLEEKAGVSVEQFFTNLRYHDPAACEMMHTYLKDLAAVIHNVQMIAECDIIIGGYMENFLQEEEYAELNKEIRKYRLLNEAEFRLIPGHYADKATVVGAGLMRIRRFLDAV